MHERQIIRRDEECRPDLDWMPRERVYEKRKISPLETISKALTEVSSQPSCEGLKAVVESRFIATWVSTSVK